MCTDILLAHLDTACTALSHRIQQLQNDLDGIEFGRTRRGKKEVLKQELAEVEEALEFFEQLLK